jgi:citrate/tricarballylate utilization protein
LNLPKALGELRLETYQEFGWPRALTGLFRRNALSVSLITAASVAFILLLVLGFKGSSVLFGSYTGENAFYRVMSYPSMVLPISALGIFLIISFLKGFINLWRETGGTLSEFVNPRGHIQAIWDTVRLRYLDGGGQGCNYPDERFSMVRRWLHHAVFYGFMACLASTTIAAFYEHFLHRAAPYPFWSWPVVLGTLGGVALLIGTGGLLYLKGQMDRVPTAPQAFSMDLVFLVLLFLTSLTGLLLLILRETSAMGILLVVHVGIVVGLFITMPYGKFIHAIYRYAALLKNAIEQSREET